MVQAEEQQELIFVNNWAKIKDLSNPTKLDMMISFIFPKWGAGRLESRTSMNFQATMNNSFTALNNKRGLLDIQSKWSSEDEDLDNYDRLKMIRTSYELFHNNPIFSGLLDRICHNLLGRTGIWPMSMTGNDDFDNAADDIYTEWALNPEITGRFDGIDLDYILTRQTLTDGDIGMLMLEDAGEIKLQLIDSARIATPQNRDRYEGTRIFNGIQVDPRTGKPTYIWIGKRDSEWNMNNNTFRHVRADNFIQMLIPRYASSYRGVTKFLSVFDKLRYLDDVMQYTLLQQKMASIFGLVIKKDKGKASPLTSKLNGIGGNKEVAGPDYLNELYPAMIATINKDEAIETIENKNPGDNFANFIDLTGKMIGAGSGVPFNYIMLDFTKANYYGQRLAADQLTSGLSGIYRALIRAKDQVRTRVIVNAVNRGKLKLPANGSLDRTFLKVLYTEPDPIEVDPEKETKNTIRRINGNLMSTAEYLRKKNRDFRQVFKQRGVEVQDAITKGLPVGIGDPGARTVQEMNAEIALKKSNTEDNNENT